MANPGKYYPNGGNPYKPPKPPAKPSNPNPGGSPGLITSTGGLFGTSGLLVVPFFDNINNVYRSISFDSTNFDCEEECIYYFRQEDVQEERTITVKQVIITYRQLGAAKFFVGVSGYSINDDKFISIEAPVTITIPKNKKPDLKVHSVKIAHQAKTAFVINCVRPQLYIRREGSSGPLAVLRAMMIGVADEGQEL